MTQNTFGKQILSTILTALCHFCVSPTLAIAQSMDALDHLIMYEQKHFNPELDTNKILRPTNYQSHQFRPENAEIFEINSYWLPKDQLDIFQDSDKLPDIGLSLERKISGQDFVLFLVHPESEVYFRNITRSSPSGPLFSGTATASSRTLLVWSNEAPSVKFFAKLSLNRKVGGIVRTISKGEVSRSIGTSKLLQMDRSNLPESFDFMPEFFGAIPKDMDRGGMILRNLSSALRKKNYSLIPLFALYTIPVGDTSSPIEKMLKKSKLTAESFVKDRLIRPFVRQWIELASKHGIVAEAHAQNVVMELDSLGLPSGKFIYRDFGGFNIDLNFRRKAGLQIPDAMPFIVSIEKDYLQHSHTKALRDSLSTYFEGGFLFGLGKELSRLGFHDQNYLGLTKMLQNEIKVQMSALGFRLQGKDFYNGLVNAILKSRKSQSPVLKSCKSLLTK